MGGAARVTLAALLAVLGIVGEGLYWTRAHGYPLGVLPERWEYEIGLYKSWPKLAPVPAGSFTMGDAGSGTRQVSFAQPTYVASTEITFAQYDLFAIATGRPLPSDNGWGRGDRPVINVGWPEAAA